MCGIVGYVGSGEASEFLIDGLRRLEYRGYDSAGIAVYENGKIQIVKKKGGLANLEDVLKEHPLHGHIGIGHTRWATHGQPSDVNAYPQVMFSSQKQIPKLLHILQKNLMMAISFLLSEKYWLKLRALTVWYSWMIPIRIPLSARRRIIL